MWDALCPSAILHSDTKSLIRSLRGRAMKNRTALVGQHFKSINSIIMKFPQIEAGLGNIHGVFEQYDEDSNGTINREELKRCLSEMHFELTDKDINDLYHYCDMDGKKGIQFREFMVLLCVAYVLMEPASASGNLSRMGLHQLEFTFSMLVEAFLFLDKNGDGKLDRKEVIRSLSEPSPGEKSPAHITMKRFKEMDWDRNGKVSFKEFLFAFTRWVGVDSDREGAESRRILVW